MKYPNYVARRKPWEWHNDVIFRVTGSQKFETDQNNAKFYQIT